MDRLLLIFSYSYMIRAFIAGILVSVIISCLGNVMVHKRLSMIGDSLAHTSLAGVAIGLIGGINPIVGAVCACLIGALFIEGIRRKLGAHSELAIAVVLSLGIGLAGVLSGFVNSGADFSSFLFGSIIATTKTDLILIGIIAAIVLVVYITLFRKIFLISFDEDSAKLLGVKVEIINIVITILTALTVSVASRIVGTLIISSLMVVPVAAAALVSKSYKAQVVTSIAISVGSTILGLVLSFLYGLKPGGTICLLAVGVFAVCFVVSLVRKR